ncbi:acetylornithine deacetylase [Pseudohalocynthiibacter aestuariivivens]|nr:acetylornithine deacetylase [Pseudohalocynthiibacter aestuariivivens]QIE45041.1 acetylornithine deacetylase [Pseudohalocynthiibacter aestuariivivens]
MTLTLELLDRLIGYDTVSARSNAGIIDFIEAFLGERGAQTARISGHVPGKCGLFARIGPEAEGGIMLSGHTDVVPVEGQDWTRAPFAMSREGERLYGRGTTDMKGYLACMLHAADLAARAPLRAPLKLVFSYDEEIGCVGIQQMLPALGPLLAAPRACFVGEPTSMQIATGHKGKAALRAICYGQNGHSALAPSFVNALYLAGDFMRELRGVQDWLATHGARDTAYDVPYSTVHVGKLSGGTALNMVPASAEMVFEYRHLAADAPDRLMARIDAAAERAATPYRAQWDGAAITIDRYNAYPGLDVPAEADIIRLAQRLVGTDTTKVAFGTEAGVFHDLGIPVVVCGPGSMTQGHQPDEYIEIGQIAACERMMQNIIDSLC